MHITEWEDMEVVRLKHQHTDETLEYRAQVEVNKAQLHILFLPRKPFQE